MAQDFLAFHPQIQIALAFSDIYSASSFIGPGLSGFSNFEWQY
jgi:hypothetical protein